MEISETKSAAKAIYLQAAALAGLEVSPQSPEKLVEIVENGFKLVPQQPGNRRPEAVANLLRLIAVTLEIAQQQGNTSLSESNVAAAQQKVCPVYPF